MKLFYEKHKQSQTCKKFRCFQNKGRSFTYVALRCQSRLAAICHYIGLCLSSGEDYWKSCPSISLTILLLQLQEGLLESAVHFIIHIGTIAIENKKLKLRIMPLLFPPSNDNNELNQLKVDIGSFPSSPCLSPINFL